MSPSCSPSRPITRTSRARMRSFTRVVSFSLMVSPFWSRFPPGDAPDEVGNEGVHRDGRGVRLALAPPARVHGAGGDLGVAEHAHHGDLLELGLADLEAELLGAVVERDAQAGLLEGGLHLG